jgi:hypothetical protein
MPSAGWHWRLPHGFPQTHFGSRPEPPVTARRDTDLNVHRDSGYGRAKTGGGEDRPSAAREGFVPTGTRSLLYAARGITKARCMKPAADDVRS